MDKEKQRTYLHSAFESFKKTFPEVSAYTDREWLAFFAGVAVGKVGARAIDEEIIDDMFNEGLAE